MRRKARKGGARQAEVTVESLGAQGDGVARLAGRPLFLPMTLPGDRVLARIGGEKAGAFHGDVIELLAAGPHHAEPPCPYFGLCGGCSLQHMAASAYGDWKADLLRIALERRGLPVEGRLRPMLRGGAGQRRRATLAAVRLASGLRLGFRERRGKRVADIAHCLLLTPKLDALIAPLRAILASLLAPGEAGEVTLCETLSGIDLLITAKGPADLEARTVLAAFAEAQDLARLSWQCAGEAPEPGVQRRAPSLDFSGVSVQPAPGAFVQPSLEGEAALVAAVCGYLPDRFDRAIDLFAGSGTFSFALAGFAQARPARVLAVEGEPAAAQALEAAVRAASLAGRVQTQCRDLARQPLLSAELQGADVIVFDPPRAGAREQAREIAASAVPCVIAVSCNPTTLARDARLLCDGGYELVEALPLDQFPWSGHLEAVALFRR